MLRRLKAERRGKNARLRAGMAVKINTKQGSRDARIIKVGRFNVDVDTNSDAQ